MSDLTHYQAREIISLLKEGKPDFVIQKIQNENISPSYAAELISDYAAMHLPDEMVIDFFIKIEAIGGKPWGDITVFKSLINKDNIAAFEYIFNHKNFELKSDFIYVINTACMKNRGIFLKMIDEKVDLFSFCMLNENNPSFINVGLYNFCDSLYEYFLPKYGNKFLDYALNDEAVLNLKKATEFQGVAYANKIFKEFASFLNVNHEIKIEKMDEIEDLTKFLKYLHLDGKLKDVAKKQKTVKI